MKIQECIPVGCVLPTAVAVCWSGVLASVHAGIPTHPWVWAWRPTHPPGVGLEIPHGQTPQLIPWVWPYRHPQARPLNLPPGCGPGDLQCMLGYHHPLWTETCNACWDTTPPMNWMTDRHMWKHNLHKLHSRAVIILLIYIPLNVMRSAIFFWHLTQNVKLNATYAPCRNIKNFGHLRFFKSFLHRKWMVVKGKFIFKPFLLVW